MSGFSRVWHLAGIAVPSRELHDSSVSTVSSPLGFALALVLLCAGVVMVVSLTRRTPPPKPPRSDEDDQGGGGWGWGRESDEPLQPAGPGGADPGFDWERFETEFRAYARDREAPLTSSS
jgi:hypothetical protein